VMQRDDGILINQDKYVADILKKFDFVTMKTASTPIEINKALLKDEEAEDVDVHLYRSMIGSLMYLTASSPNIMFAICACASQEWIEGQSGGPPEKVGDEAVHKELGDRMKRVVTTASSLEAEQDNVLPVQVNAAEGDFINTSIQGFIQFFIRFQSFKHSLKAKTVNGERQLQALIDKKKVIIMESSIIHLEDAGGTDCLPTATIFEELARMGV
ncbi:hypothetical protein Tco_1298790, partial [Tanacetum coccineum]